MVKEKHLSARQLNVIEELFACELDEQAVLDKYNVGAHLYNKWLSDETFVEKMEKRIAASYRRVAAYIARYAPLAAAKLVQLTDSEKPETARRACLDIISRKSPRRTEPAAAPRTQTRPERSRGNAERKTQNAKRSASDEIPRFSPEIAGKLLAVLAADKSSPAD